MRAAACLEHADSNDWRHKAANLKAHCNMLMDLCSQAGLAARGAEVVRLNTYSTLPVAELPPVALQQARRAEVVAFASPSAVKAWLELAGEGARAVAAACIGAASLTLAPAYAYFCTVRAGELPARTVVTSPSAARQWARAGPRRRIRCCSLPVHAHMLSSLAMTLAVCSAWTGAKPASKLLCLPAVRRCALHAETRAASGWQAGVKCAALQYV